MLELLNQKAKLSSVAPNAVNHGEDKMPVTYLKFVATVSNDVLHMLDPKLLDALYTSAGKGKQDDLTGHKPELKFQNLGAIKWDYVGAGYGLQIHYGATGGADIKLADVQIDRITVTCKPGGSVELVFRAIAHPSETDGGRLNNMVQQDVEITLTAPEEEEEQKAA